MSAMSEARSREWHRENPTTPQMRQQYINEGYTPNSAGGLTGPSFPGGFRAGNEPFEQMQRQNMGGPFGRGGGGKNNRGGFDRGGFGGLNPRGQMRDPRQGFDMNGGWGQPTGPFTPQRNAGWSEGLNPVPYNGPPAQSPYGPIGGGRDFDMQGQTGWNQPNKPWAPLDMQQGKAPWAPPDMRQGPSNPVWTGGITGKGQEPPEWRDMINRNRGMKPSAGEDYWIPSDRATTGQEAFDPHYKGRKPANDPYFQQQRNRMNQLMMPPKANRPGGKYEGPDSGGNKFQTPQSPWGPIPDLNAPKMGLGAGGVNPRRNRWDVGTGMGFGGPRARPFGNQGFQRQNTNQPMNPDVRR
jgi:hypothetical protein